MCFTRLCGDIQTDVESALKVKYGESSNLSHQLYLIPVDLKNKLQSQVKQKFFRDEIHTWTISVNDSTCYTALLDNTLGKSMPITFMVVMSSDGMVDNADIIKYREPYGGEIENDKWSGQFINKGIASGFSVGTDINGISGATISVNSVSKGIHKLVLLYPHIKELFTCKP